MQYKLFKVRASCCTEQCEEAGTVDKLEEAWIRLGQECVFTMASNLLKCSLNGEAEIRMLLIDLDLEWQSHKAGGKETSLLILTIYCLKCISSRLNLSGFFRLLKTVFKVISHLDLFATPGPSVWMSLMIHPSYGCLLSLEKFFHQGLTHDNINVGVVSLL